MVVKLAREHGVDAKARSYTVWSHVVSLVFAQLSAAVSLNDVCDNLRVHSGGLSSVRGAKAPARNTLSHANKSRDAAMAEALFWAVLAHLRDRSPGFGSPRKRRRGLPARFRRTIHAMDSTTIQLVANCLDWARHRRRKAAAKCHLRLNLQSFLPEFAVVDTARQSDNRRARELCAGLRAGEIGVFDKAYIDFEHLYDLDRRGVFWVTRAKDNMACEVIERLPEGSQAKILSDEIVVLSTPHSQQAYPEPLRRIKFRDPEDPSSPYQQLPVGTHKYL